MKIIVIGHGMVGHKFLESLAGSGTPDLHITVLCEEPRPAYDRVHLSEFFAGKTAEDLSLVKPGFFDRDDMVLRLNTRATAIDRAAKTVTTGDGSVLPYDKLVIATGSFPFVPPLPGKERKDCFVYRTIEDLEAMLECGARSKTGVVIGGGLLGQSTKIYDRATGEVTYGRVPAGSVVVSGNLPSADGSHSLYCAVIVKRVDAKTRAKTGINELLRGI